MIFYLRALEEDSDLSLLAVLQNEFGSELQCIEFSALDPRTAGLNIEATIEPYFRDDIILVGQQTGAFFSNFYCEKFNLKSVLISPCFDPFSRFSATLEAQDIDLAAYSQFPIVDLATTYKLVFVTADDSQSSPSYIRKFLPRHHATVFDGGHQNASAQQHIVEAIRFTSNNFVDPTSD